MLAGAVPGMSKGYVLYGKAGTLVLDLAAGKLLMGLKAEAGELKEVPVDPAKIATWRVCLSRSPTHPVSIPHAGVGIPGTWALLPACKSRSGSSECMRCNLPARWPLLYACWPVGAGPKLMHAYTHARMQVEEEFVSAIRGKEVVRRTTFEQGVRYMQFAEAVTHSYQSGCTVRLPC